MRLVALSFEKSRGARQAKNRDNKTSSIATLCGHNPELSAIVIRN